MLREWVDADGEEWVDLHPVAAGTAAELREQGTVDPGWEEIRTRLREYELGVRTPGATFQRAARERDASQRANGCPF